MPPGASPHCLDLLKRIMTVDCDKRITIPDIMQHPWFLEDLPLGLEEANSSLLEAPLALQFCKQSEVGLTWRLCTACCPAILQIPCGLPVLEVLQRLKEIISRCQMRSCEVEL